MSSQYIFTMHRLSKLHPPDKTVLDNITLAFYPGAKIGVLGYNGAGKSTLLRIMAGRRPGVPRRGGAGARARAWGCSSRSPHLDESKNVKGNVEEGVAETKALLDRFNELAANYSDETAEEFGDIQAKIDAADAWNLDTQLEYAMDALRLPPPDADVSHALRRRAPSRGAVPAAAARAGSAAAGRADQPPRRRVGGLAGAAPVRVQGRDRGRHARPLLPRQRRGLDPRARPRQGHPLRGQLLELARAEAGAARPRKSARKRAAERTIAAELEWVRTNPKGKRTKSKARLARYEELIAEERNIKLDEVQIHIPPGPRLGEKVLTATDVSKGFGDRLLIESLSFDLPRAGIVGVIGANGAGKTTLFRMITGEEAPDAGEIELGDTVQLAYVDQSRDALNPRRPSGRRSPKAMSRSRSASARSTRASTRPASTSRATDQQARIGKLSGGERNRVHLAKLLRSGGNLLLLDEPTNDLDVDTLRALEDALLAFPGCAVVISHDRWFLDRVATHVLAFEGDSQVTWFEGNFEAYEEHRRELLGAAADRPHRITYKRLVRG